VRVIDRSPLRAMAQRPSGDPLALAQLRIAEVSEHGRSEPVDVRGGAADELARRAVVHHLADAADVERDDGLAKRHGLEDRARKRVFVDARDDGDVEVADVRAHVGLVAGEEERARQAELVDQGAAFLEVVRAHVLGCIAEDDEAGAPTLLRRHRVDRDSCRSDHLDVSLARQDAPLAPEDDCVPRESQLAP
jgi:hypothetical protein